MKRMLPTSQQFGRKGRPEARPFAELRRSDDPGRVIEGVEKLRTQRRQAQRDCFSACYFKGQRMTALGRGGEMAKHMSGAPVKVVLSLVLLARRGRLVGGVVLSGAMGIDESGLLAVAAFFRAGFPSVSGSEHRQKH